VANPTGHLQQRAYSLPMIMNINLVPLLVPIPMLVLLDLFLDGIMHKTTPECGRWTNAHAIDNIVIVTKKGYWNSAVKDSRANGRPNSIVFVSSGTGIQQTVSVTDVPRLTPMRRNRRAAIANSRPWSPRRKQNWSSLVHVRGHERDTTDSVSLNFS